MQEKHIPQQLCPCKNSTDKPLHVYLCEDSPEGILSAIYDAWSSRYGHSYNYIQIDRNLDFNMFYEYFPVKTDVEKAKSIADAVKRKVSYLFYEFIESCLLSADENRADDIYRLIILGFHVGGSAKNYLSYPFVQRLNKLERNVRNERHHYLGFIRFEELDNNMLFAKFRPVNNIITLVMPHFADRFPNDNIMIIDVKRGIIAFSKHGKIALATATDSDLADLTLQNSENELMLKRLWKSFVDTIEVKERRNIDLQKQNMPLRFREFMIH